MDLGVLWNTFLLAKQVHAHCYCAAFIALLPAEGKKKEALSELIPRSVGGWIGIPLVQASHGHGACSPGNSGVAGFFCVFNCSFNLS